MTLTLDTRIATDHSAGKMLAALVSSRNPRARVVLTVALIRYGEAGEEVRYHEVFVIRKWTGRDNAENLTVEIKDSGDFMNGVKPIRVVNFSLLTRREFACRDERGQKPLLRIAAEEALRFAWTGRTRSFANGRVEVSTGSFCGACGAKLVDDVSIQRGLGPCCFGARTGSRKIRDATPA